MHELSIALNLIDLAAERAQRLGDAKVVAVHLKLGQLAGVVQEALLSAFEQARQGSALSEARFVIEDVPVVVHCSMCLTDGEPVSIQDMRCRNCGSPTPQIIRGRELEIAALEVVDESPATTA